MGLLERCFWEERNGGEKSHSRLSFLDSRHSMRNRNEAAVSERRDAPR
jgi:hypothetical protein